MRKMYENIIFQVNYVLSYALETLLFNLLIVEFSVSK